MFYFSFSQKSCILVIEIKDRQLVGLCILGLFDVMIVMIGCALPCR